MALSNSDVIEHLVRPGRRWGEGREGGAGGGVTRYVRPCLRVAGKVDSAALVAHARRRRSITASPDDASNQTGSEKQKKTRSDESSRIHCSKSTRRRRRRRRQEKRLTRRCSWRAATVPWWPGTSCSRSAFSACPYPFGRRR